MGFEKKFHYFSTCRLISLAHHNTDNICTLNRNLDQNEGIQMIQTIWQWTLLQYYYNFLYTFAARINFVAVNVYECFFYPTKYRRVYMDVCAMHVSLDVNCLRRDVFIEIQ